MLRVILCLASVSMAFGQAPLSEREKALLERIEQLEKRITALEQRLGTGGDAGAAHAEHPASTSTRAGGEMDKTAEGARKGAPAALGTSPPQPVIAALIDGYYSYNFNEPRARRSAVRAFDSAHNAFTTNQASLLMELAPDVARNRRYGARVDLMFGRATETLQGSPLNEPRPNVYRHLWQAYGTYVAPVGKGLTIDAGKWAGSLGAEGNYTKDQFNYSRSFYFVFLPFYHQGIRTSYPVTGNLTAGYWLVNGSGQSEEFNNAKSQAVTLSGTVGERWSWTANYYSGRESGGAMNGRLHILDSYMTFKPDAKWTLQTELDYVVARDTRTSPARVGFGGIGWTEYRFNRRLAAAGRFEYLNDRGRLYSGTPQALKETTLTATWFAAQGFQLKLEFRRDFSNVRFFETSRPGVFAKHQNTALVGMTWWMGNKKGAW